MSEQSVQSPPPAVPPTEVYRFTPRARLILAAILRVVLPSRPDIEERDRVLVDYIERFVPSFPPMLRMSFPLGLYALEYATPLFAFTLVPFSRMDPGQARRYIEGWRHSRLAVRRQLVQGVAALGFLGFYSLPEVMKYIGFEYPAYAQARIEYRKALVAARAAGLPPPPDPLTHNLDADPRDDAPESSPIIADSYDEPADLPA